MTVVAVKSNVIAADRMASVSGTALTVPKLFTVRGGSLVRVVSGEKYPIVIAISGDYGLGLMRAQWFADSNTDRTDYPKAIDTHWARIVVATYGNVAAYEDYPIAINYLDDFIAFGSGMDYAMGAMRNGADATQAVQVTCAFDTSCGNGVEFARLVRFPDSTILKAE